MQIKTIEDAFAYTGRDIKALPDVSGLPEKDRQYLIAAYKVVVVTEAISKEANDGKDWQPDWNNSSQWKYFPCVYIKASNEQPAGFGFSGTNFGNACTATGVGSRLCFPTSDAALYAIRQFEDLYKQYFLIQ